MFYGVFGAADHESDIISGKFTTLGGLWWCEIFKSAKFYKLFSTLNNKLFNKYSTNKWSKTQSKTNE